MPKTLTVLSLTLLFVVINSLAGCAAPQAAPQAAPPAAQKRIEGDRKSVV